MTINGTAGNDVLDGTPGNDIFDLTQGGDDIATGDAGKDTFKLGAALTAADQLDGGSGNDTLTLDGDYSAGLGFAATTIVDVEAIHLAAHNDYDLTTDNANVAAGKRLAVNAAQLGGARHLIFDGSAETNGHFTVTGGAGGDDITGGAKSDKFDLTNGGDDTAHGGAGNDTFILGDALTAADTINGGLGIDKATLDGDYTGVNAVVFGATTMTNIETLILGAGHGYDLTTHNATVSAGNVLTVDASALGAGDSLNFNGAAEANGHFIVKLGAGSYNLIGSQKDDAFEAYGANIVASDAFNGGAGNDYLILDGDYSGGLLFNATTMTNVENLTLFGGHSYNLTINDATAASGATLSVVAYFFGAGDTLTFDGSAETDAFNLSMTGGPGDDYLIGGGSNAHFDLTQGGDDTAYGGSGWNFFYLGNTLTAADSIDGGSGTLNTLYLDGDYTGAHAVVFGPNTIHNLTNIALEVGHSYTLTTNDANVGAGETLEIGGSIYGSANSDVVTFDGSAETDGAFTFHTGDGDDVLIGGAQADSFDAQGGADTITSGAGADTFLYFDVGPSTSTTHDFITDFDASADKFDLPVSVTGYDGEHTEALNPASFDTTLASAVTAAGLSAGHAILIQGDGTSGSLMNHLILVVDANGDGAYSGGSDYVFDITGATNLGSLGTGNFI